MASFMEPYVKAIDQATDYNMLTQEISNNIVRLNIAEHVSNNIIAAIDRIGVDSSYYEFVQKLVLCSTLTNYSSTYLNILTYFCNKLAQNFDSLQYEPDAFTLLIMVICCDDRSFVKKLSLEQKTHFGYAVMKYLRGEEIEALSPGKEYPSANGTVMSILLDCAIDGYTMEQLEHEIQRYSASDWVKPDWLIGYLYELVPIASQIDKESLLDRINHSVWSLFMDEKVDKLAHELCKNKNLGITADPFWVKGFINDILCIFCTFRDDILATGYTQIACEPVGKLIKNLMDSIHQGYTHIGIDGNYNAGLAMSEVLKFTLDIYHTGYPSDGAHRKLLDDVVDRFFWSGKAEAGWMEGPYLKALKLAYDKDEEFAHYKEYFNTWKADPSVVYSFEELLRAYENPAYEAALMLLPATEAKKPQRWTYDDDDEDQNDQKKDQEGNEESESSENEDQNEERKDSGYDIEATQSTKGYDKKSKKLEDGTNKIYRAFKNYKNNEAKVDSQIDKMLTAAKQAFTPDKTEQIISGKRFTPIGLLKKCLLTAGIFSWSKVGGIIYLVVSHTLAKNRTDRERKEILVQLEEEIKILDEKIEDARGDGNRQAKYALMRTRAELKNARDKIRFKTTATKTDLKTAVNYIKHPARAFDRGGRREDEQY